MATLQIEFNSIRFKIDKGRDTKRYNCISVFFSAAKMENLYWIIFQTCKVVIWNWKYFVNIVFCDNLSYNIRYGQ